MFPCCFERSGELPVIEPSFGDVPFAPLSKKAEAGQKAAWQLRLSLGIARKPRPRGLL